MLKFKIGHYDQSVPLNHRRKAKKPDLILDFCIEIDGCLLRVPAKVRTDGESSPSILHPLTGESFAGVNIGPALVHDAACSGDLQIYIDDRWQRVYLDLGQNSALFRDFSLAWNERSVLDWIKWAVVSPAVWIRGIHISKKAWLRKHPDGLIFSEVAARAVLSNPVRSKEG